MESTNCKTPVSYDQKNKGCDTEEIEILCDIFENVMQQIAPSFLRKGVYDLNDFELSKKHEIEGFTLTMERQVHPDGEQWKGFFEAENRTLEVWGTLE